MAFLDKLSKRVGKAAEQAKFEADKLVRVNKLNSEVNAFAREIEEATTNIGAQVVELQKAGEIQVPEVADLIDQVQVLEERLEAKQAELEEAKALKFEDAEEAEPSAATAAEPLTIESAAETEACAECGAAVKEGAKFCPECGHKMEA